MTHIFHDERFSEGHSGPIWPKEADADKWDAAGRKAAEAAVRISEIQAEEAAKLRDLHQPRGAHVGEGDPNRSQYEPSPLNPRHRAEEEPFRKFKDE